MAVSIKSAKELERMREAGRILNYTLRTLEKAQGYY